MSRFLKDAERGPTGDHGQPGERGERGRQGLPGAPGGSTPVLRLRMLVLYVTTIALLVAVGWMYQRGEADRALFEKVVVVNCFDNRANTINFNEFIDTLIATYEKSDLLTPKEVRERTVFFEAAKGGVPSCPPDRDQR